MIKVKKIETQDTIKVDTLNMPTKTSDLTNDSNFVEDSNYIHTDNNYTDIEKTKLKGLNNYDDTELKQNISDIQKEQIAQDTKIETLKQRTGSIENRNIEQDAKILENSNNITDINNKL